MIVRALSKALAAVALVANLTPAHAEYSERPARVIIPF